MGRILIAIFLLCFGYIVYYVIKLLIKERYTETFISDTQGNPMMFLDEHDQPDHSLEFRDDHWWLMTSLTPGKKAIVQLKETNPEHSNYYYLSPEATYVEATDAKVATHNPSKLSYPKLKSDLTCVGEKHPIRKLVQHYQPFMYDKPELINYYDQPLYRDWRYAESPVDLRFLADPDKYCKDRPLAYPCAKYYSKW